MKFLFMGIAVFILCGFVYVGPETEMLDIINDKRAELGVTTLQKDWELARLARYKTEEMQQLGFMCHSSPAYGLPEDMLEMYNIPFKTLGTNVAMGQETAGDVVTAWLTSEAHRNILLCSNFTHAGTAKSYNEDGIAYWVIILRNN